MSQPWSYYNTSGYYPYPYYGYGYNAQTNPAQPAGDGVAQNENENASQPVDANAPSSVPLQPPTADPYTLYAMQVAAAASYTTDPALDAAQRWNAMNCSYFNSLSRAPPTSTNASNNATPSKPIISTENKPKTSQLFEAGGGKDKWSPELKEYVQRAFLSAETDVERDQMERILRQKIEYVFLNKKTVDWSKEQIPVIPKISSIIGPNSKSTINLVRPANMQPWKARGNAGSLQTGTLIRNQSSNMNSSLADSFQKSKYLSPLPQNSSTNSDTSDLSPKFPDLNKRKRPIRQRSSSSSRSSRSSSYEAGVSSRKNFKGNKNKKQAHDNSYNTESDEPQPQAKSKSKQNKNKKRNAKRKAKMWEQPNTAQSRLNERAERFKDHLDTGSIAKSTSKLNLLSSQMNDEELLENRTFIGTMQELEKPYLRLTKAPLPSEVRPESVLKRSLAHVVKRYRNGKDYHWVCDQLKSIRQDLIVQRIQSEFAAKVYETHADIALEIGDSSEFHQCQSQLALLHADGYGSDRCLEFTAYRLLYYISTEDRLGMNKLLSTLENSAKSNPFVRFALKVCEYWSLGNYKRFIEMACNPDSAVPYETESCSMQSCRSILAWSLERERISAAKKIFLAYRPKLCFHFISKTLGFEDVNSCAEFISEKLGVNLENLTESENVDTKAIWMQIQGN